MSVSKHCILEFSPYDIVNVKNVYKMDVLHKKFRLYSLHDWVLQNIKILSNTCRLFSD